MSIRVLYDGEAFLQHARGGIPRYLTELISEFRSDPGLGVTPVTPYRWVATRHLAEHDRRFTELPLPRQLRLPVLRAMNARRLRQSGAADIVHHSLYEPAAFERWPGRRHVTTVYDFMLERFPELLQSGDDHPERLAKVIHRADAIICISETTKADLHRFHPECNKPVYAVPLGVSDSFFDPTPVKLPALPERYLLYVGNRMSHKNIDILFEAYAEVARKRPDLKLVLVGAYVPTEIDRIRAFGLEDRTIRLRVSDAVLPWIYRKAEALMYTSLWEGFGLPVVEAMASGCPTVIADIGALTEVGGEAALVFEPTDRATLVNHLEHILTDPGEAQRLRQAGLERARLFTWRRTAERTAEVYQQIVDA